MQKIIEKNLKDQPQHAYENWKSYVSGLHNGKSIRRQWWWCL